MDAFAVSIASGMTITKERRRAGLLTAAFFGGFQMLMPVVGWAIGLTFASVIAMFDHWMAFGLLVFIGAKMIYEGAKKDEDHNIPRELRAQPLLILSVATSIDALMVGLSFALLKTAILLPVAAIGAITFGLSLVGFYFGCGLGKVFGRRIEIVGGIVLIAIGLRILLEHLPA